MVIYKDSYALNNGDLFIGGNFKRASVAVENGVIARISADPIEGGEDCRDKYILPGIIDLHTHGCAGFDFATAGAGEMRVMTERYAEAGVTSVLATTISMPREECMSAAARIGEAMKGPRAGARIRGINMEGPFLGAAKKGAHDERFLIPPDAGFFDEMNERSGGNIKIVDLDPAYEGAMEFIKEYSKKLVVSIAHTAADWETAMRAFENGASHVTHLFNAMSPFSHREPGVVGAFTDDAVGNVCAELIADGFHVHPSAVRMIFSAAPGRVALVSDSMCAAGMPDGVYELGGLSVLVSNGKAVLKDAPGTIAGSVTNAFACVKNAIDFGVPAEEAVGAATEIPAGIIGIRAGKIKVGYDADLLIVDEDFNIEKVFVF